jgi:predicted amidophosphoribosyltransferase
MAFKCPKCQAENPDTARFCLDCGIQLASRGKIQPEITATLQPPVRELTTGSAFAGRYQIIEELGYEYQTIKPGAKYQGRGAS